MTAEEISFPYPVLGNSDDLKGQFEWDLAVRLTRTVAKLQVRLRFQNPDLERLLSEKKARIVLQVQCPLTFYREDFALASDAAEIEIPGQVLREAVELVPFISASKPIARYKPISAHRDYDGAVFQVSEGGVLAVGSKAFFVADKEFLGSKRRLRSIMEFVKHTREGADPEVRWGNDRIEIYINSDDWAIYQEAKTNPFARNLIHSGVVFPVLLDALSRMDQEDYAGNAWCTRLRVLLKEKGLEDAEKFEQAMGLLRNPISRGFAGIKGLLDPEEDENDDDE